MGGYNIVNTSVKVSRSTKPVSSVKKRKTNSKESYDKTDLVAFYNIRPDDGWGVDASNARASDSAADIVL